MWARGYFAVSVGIGIRPKKLWSFSNLSLLFLPPASPELNPQEQVWLKLRQDSLSNLAFKDYDDIVEKSCIAWNSFVSQKHAVTNLCQRSWVSLQV